MPTQSIHVRPKLGNVNMGYPCQSTEVWRKKFVPATTCLGIFGYAQMTSIFAWRVGRSGCWIGQIFTLYGQWRLGLTLHKKRFLYWQAIAFNCNNIRPYLHIVVWIQCPTFPPPDHILHVLRNMCVPFNTWFSKPFHCNLLAPLHGHINKWESTSHMDGIMWWV